MKRLIVIVISTVFASSLFADKDELARYKSLDLKGTGVIKNSIRMKRDFKISPIGPRGRKNKLTAKEREQRAKDREAAEKRRKSMLKAEKERKEKYEKKKESYNAPSKSYNNKNNSYNSSSNNNSSKSNNANRYRKNKVVTTKVGGEVVSSPILTPIPDPIVHLKKLNKGAMINLDYTDVSLQDIVKYISDITNTNFIVPDRLKNKKVTIISPRKVTPYEALNAFFTVLNIHNYSVVRTGKYYKIVPIRDAKKPNHIYFQNDRVPNVDYLVTKIYTFKYADVREIERLINKLKSTNGNVAYYEPAGMLIYTDMGRTVNNIFKIVKQLDVPASLTDQIWMIPIYYADVRELAKLIEDIFDVRNNRNKKKNRITRTTSKVKGSKSSLSRKDLKLNDKVNVSIEKIISDERTGQLIVKSDENSKNKLIELIRKLDVPMEDDSTIHVYELQNAKAKDMSQTIASLVSGSKSRSKSRKSRKASNLGGGVIFQGEVKVTADEATNSLVIVASGRDYNSLRKVIELLDIKRKQVYVEAVIMEISVDKSLDLGVSIDGGYETNIAGEKVPMFAGTNYGNLSAISINPAALTGFAFGAMTPSIEVTDGLSIPGFGVILKALQTNSSVNVLSSPQVLTMDNEEAEFVVGENVPFPSGISSYSGSSSSNFSPMISIQRQDVAIQLKIKPQISGNNQVKLEVNQEIKEVKSLDPILGPTTSKRQVKTTVVVPDQKTIVIGGLMKDNVKTTENKVPILGSIPIIGNLFKYQTKRVSKSNLLIFLTPYIIRDSKDMDKIWKKKIKEYNEFKRLKTRADKGFDIFMDYSKKRGLLSEINTKVKEYELKVKRENKLKIKHTKRNYNLDEESNNKETKENKSK